MPYSPPGVQTIVVIDNTTVTLPGGTRILSLIGNADKTKTVSGEQQIQPISRLVNVNNSGLAAISRIYDFSGPGQSLYTYPTSGAGAFGSGYFNVGDSIEWTKAANPFPTSTTPAVGDTFFVTYSGSFAGSGVSTLYTGEPVVQTSSHNDLLANSGITILAVSGSSGFVYPASGTVTGPDTLGFGRDGSGYYLTSSGTLAWNPVTPSAYGYPFATVVPVSGSFFVDYTYNKTASDYAPKNFVDFRSVITEYGNEARWTLITSGVNAGAYTLAGINPLTLGSKIAFQNNASLLTLVEISGAGSSSGDFLSTVALLEPKTVDIIVPLTIGSGNTRNAMSIPERALALNYIKLHCDTQSNPANQKERVSIGSLGDAEVGDDSTPNTYIYTAEVGLDDKRISLIAPGIATLQLQDPAGVFQNVDVDGSFLAVAAASFSVSPLNDVATPLTNKELIGFTSISAKTSSHTATEYFTTEMNNLAAAGVMVIAQEGPRIFIRHQLTTDQSNVVNGEFSVVTLIDFVSQAVRFSCKGFIGQKLKPATTIPAVKGAILATLQTLAQNDIISSIGGITVGINPLNPTELLVEAAYTPIFPLNRIKVTFTIKTLG